MIAPARAAAFEILAKMERSDGHSDELLRGPAVNALSSQDRNLTTTLVMGTLRWQLLLDRRIAALLARPDTKLALPVQAALRLGVFQLLVLERIPPHAAIGESVELAKHGEGKFAAGMVNAVLRKFAGQPRLDANHPANTLAAHPEWMVERWAGIYGKATSEAICHYDQQQPPFTIRMLEEETEASLREEHIELAPGEFLSKARRVLRGDITRTTAFRSGAVRIQDEGSQLVAELAGHGERILDLCAAPGGKTAILAERNPQAQITACDISARRLDSMRRLMSGTPGAERIRYLQTDAAGLRLKPEYDLVLCDVPCSGTGTIARNPEIRLRLTRTEFDRQQARQVAILTAALGGLAPGGRLIYATCSLEPEENEQVIERCVGRDSAFELQPFGPIGRLPRSVLANGFLRTVPGIHGCDGFFAAQIVRSHP